uniref:Uncharacterized protein n=1 Tax=Meloidogyne javanica TaxID=6303 RepID=A0A915MBA4_MELJA
MNGTEEDSFDFPEFLEKENCLPASNSSTTSSIFESLNSAHLLQSTSQQPTEKIQKPEFLKCSNSLHNRGVYPISPIAEEFRGDLDNLVSYVDNLREVLSDEIIQNLAIPLRNLSDKFERQQNELNVNWEIFNTEREKFNYDKLEEWANISEIRYAFGKSFNEDNTKINDYSEILDSSELSCSRFCEPLNLVPAPFAQSKFNNMDISLNKKFELPFEMVNTMYKLTNRGKEFTFNDGSEEIIVTELSGCENHYCLLYEYPNKLICGNENDLDKSRTKYFRWTTVPLLPKINSNGNKIEINFLQKYKFYRVYTPVGHIVRFLSSGQIEIWWKSGDKTIILPDGERNEYFGSRTMEIYLPDGTAFRLEFPGQREEFIPNSEKMSVRPDGSYSLYNKKLHADMENSSKFSEDVYLQINAPDFRLRRFNSTKAVKMVIPTETSSGGSIEILFFVDKAFIVNHVHTGRGDFGQKKHSCFRFCIMAGTEGYNQQTGGVDSTFPLTEELRGDLNKIISKVSKLNDRLVGSKVIKELDTQLKNFSLKFNQLQKELKASLENQRLEKSKFTQDRIIQGCKNTNMFLELTAQERSFDLKELDFEKKLSNLQSELDLHKSQCVCQHRSKAAFNKISDQIEPGQKSGSTRSQTTEYFNINKEMPLNQLFELDSRMVHTGNKLTGRGREYTFCNGYKEIIVVELIGCGNSSYSQHCLLHEYPESVENEKVSSKSTTKYFALFP